MIYFFLQMGDGSFLTLIALILAYLLVIVFSITIHEFAHGYTAYKFGDFTAKAQGRLSLNPAKHIDPIGALCFLFIGFGWARPVNVNPMAFKGRYKLAMSLVSLAGIFVNFVVAFIFSSLLYFLSSFGVSSNLFLNFLYYIFFFGVIINLSLAVFNLMPIYPLDGFNFIKTFLSYENKFVEFMTKYGNIILIIFILTPIFDIIYGFLTNTILQGFFAFWGLFA